MAVLSEYPRPGMRRQSYISLNVVWKYAIREEETTDSYDGEIMVPYSPEAELSGVRRQLLPERHPTAVEEQRTAPSGKLLLQLQQQPGEYEDRVGRFPAGVAQTANRVICPEYLRERIDQKYFFTRH